MNSDTSDLYRHKHNKPNMQHLRQGGGPERRHGGSERHVGGADEGRRKHKLKALNVSEHRIAVRRGSLLRTLFRAFHDTKNLEHIQHAAGRGSPPLSIRGGEGWGGGVSPTAGRRFTSCLHQRNPGRPSFLQFFTFNQNHRHSLPGPDTHLLQPEPDRSKK